MQHGVTPAEVMNVTREILNANGGVIYEYGTNTSCAIISTDRGNNLPNGTLSNWDSSSSPASMPGIPFPHLLEDIADVRIGAKLPKLGMLPNAANLPYC